MARTWSGHAQPHEKGSYSFFTCDAEKGYDPFSFKAAVLSGLKPQVVVTGPTRQDKMNDNALPPNEPNRCPGDERSTQSMPLLKLHKTVGVKVGQVQVGGGAPIVVQSMTMTDTADVRATAEQSIELAAAGSEMVRVTVNLPEAAAAVPEIKQRMLDAGCTVPLIGDFHYNGHLLLTRFPDCARALDKYRINPGNVGTGTRRDEQFATICKVAVDCNKPVRIGVNGGSLNQELVTAKMQENTDRDLGRTSEEIINECMVLSAVESTALAIESGLRKDQIIISCKTSRPRDLIAVYRELARRTDQPLHLGLTEAGMGLKGPGLVGLGDGRAARRRHRRHRARLVDAEAGRRPARRGLRRLRAAPGPRPSRVLAQRHRLSRAAGGRPAPRSRSSPNAFRITFAKRCRNGRPSTPASNR